MKRRGNGSGTLVRRSESSPWVARWSYKGKIYNRSTHTTDRAKAERELERLTRPFRADTAVETIRELASRVEAAQDAALIERRLPLESLEKVLRERPEYRDLAKGTLHSYCTFVRDFVKWTLANTRHVDATTVDAPCVKSYLGCLASRTSPGTFNLHVVFLRKFWKVLSEGYGLKADAFEGVSKRRVPRMSSRRAIDDSELCRLMELAKGNLDMKILVSLGDMTGMRLSDACLLRWDSFDRVEKVIRYVPIKTKNWSTGLVAVPVVPALERVLEEAWAASGDHSGYVSAKNAGMYASRTITRAVARLFRRAGMETFSRNGDGTMVYKVGFHSLRHRFVSKCIEAGMSEFHIQRLVGHTDLTTTERYTHLNLESMRKGLQLAYSKV